MRKERSQINYYRDLGKKEIEHGSCVSKMCRHGEKRTNYLHED